MSEAGSNLTGRWDGTYSYPDVPEAGPITPFLATLIDRGGGLTGTIIEAHEFVISTAHSTLIGQRIGRSVHFAKTYHDAGDDYRETVLYYGTLSGDGDVITGEWQIDHWRGPFEMTRELPAQAEAQAEEAAEEAAEEVVEAYI